jgi:ribosomal protein L35AE/L33A
MSARKIQSIGSPEQSVTVTARQSNLTLSPESVIIRKGGIEFRSETPCPQWVEMTVAIESPQDGGKVNCSGVVVDCSGNKHIGFLVSMVFTGMSKQAEARLHVMSRPVAG